MLFNDRSNKLFPLAMIMMGLLLFLAYGVFISNISDFNGDFDLLILSVSIVLVPVISCFMLVLFGFLKIGDILSFLLRSELFILASAFIGLILMFIFSYAFEYVLGYLSEFFVSGLILIFMNIINGNVIGHFIFGRKSWRFFSAVYGLVAVFFAILMSFTVSNDVTMITTSFGTATGFAVGLYAYRAIGHTRLTVITIVTVIIGIFLILGFYTSEKATLTSLPDPERIIVFEDEAFELTVRDYYFLGEGDILWKDIGYRKSLDWWERELAGRIISLDDLKWFANLEHLSLNNGDINGEISSISTLDKLRTLHLDRTGIVGNINHLSGLEKLEQVRISSTPVSGDIESLTGLENLRRLSLTGTAVSGDLSSFYEHEMIEELRLRDSYDD